MSGVESAHLADVNVLEIRRAAEDEVRATALVCQLLVALLAGASGEEEPALQPVAPRGRLVDEIPCGGSMDYGKGCARRKKTMAMATR